jgi:hypothetical protein
MSQPSPTPTVYSSLADMEAQLLCRQEMMIGKNVNVEYALLVDYRRYALEVIFPPSCRTGTMPYLHAMRSVMCISTVDLEFLERAAHPKMRRVAFFLVHSAHAHDEDMHATHRRTSPKPPITSREHGERTITHLIPTCNTTQSFKNKKPRAFHSMHSFRNKMMAHVRLYFTASQFPFLVSM